MRLSSLDSVRGFAALLVVVYHFQHLSAVGQQPESWSVAVASLPLFGLLKPVYLYGWMAVDLFFAISGFVFFWIYQEAIRERTIDASSFFILRGTRLYPLHVLTLLLVIGLQAVYGAAMGGFFVVPYNDGYHFWLNVLFLQSWGFEHGPSFNGPSWSISIEVLLYLIFFVFSLSRLSQSATAVVGAVCLGLIVQLISPVIGRGIAGFFAGGLAFHALTLVRRRPDARTIAVRVVALTGVLWLAVLAASYGDAIEHLLAALGHAESAGLAGKAGNRLVLYVLFPLTVLALAASETVLGLNWKGAHWLGDISYAAYLMHFPLQLAIACLVAWGGLTEASVTGLPGLIAFLALLVPLSWLTYRYFELPMQRFGRRVLLGRKPRIA